MVQQDWSARGFAKHGYRSVARNPGILAKQSVPWLVFLILVQGLIVDPMALHGAINEFVAVVVEAAFVSGIGLGWYRLVLLNERPHWSALISGKRGLKFFAWAVLAQAAISVISLADVIPNSVIAQRDLKIIALIVFLIAAYFVLRISLGFPLTAIDAPKPIATAWRLSKGDVWLLCRVALLTYMPFQWSSMLLLKMAERVASSASAVLAAGIVLGLVSMILIVVGACVTAGAFAEVMRAKTQPGGLESPLFWDR